MRAILRRISRFDAGAAVRLKVRVDEMLVPLLEHPYLFRRGKLSDTREMVVHPNYVVVYKVAVDHIRVVAILHTRRKYPPPEPAD
jgi:toxin ParE1/3/4